LVDALGGEIVVFTHSFTICRPEYLEAGDVVALNFQLNVVVRREKCIVKVLKQVFLQMVVFNSTEVVKTFKSNEALTCTRLKLIRYTNDGSVNV
jgi:hypothetical protein